MPTNYIKSLSKKHNISVAELDKCWEEAKKDLGDQYKDNEEMKYGTIVKIFKNIINKKFDLKESFEMTIKDFIFIKSKTK